MTTRAGLRRPRWSVRSRDLAVVSALTLLVVGVTTAVHLVRLSRLTIEDSRRQGELLAQEVYALARDALSRPSLDPGTVLAADPAIAALLDAHIGYSRQLVYALVVDRQGTALVHRPEGVLPGEHPPLAELLELGELARLRAVTAPGGLYEVRLPLALDGEPFATVRLGISTALVRTELRSALTQGLRLAALALAISWLAALALAQLTLRPLRRLRSQIGQMRRGELEPEPDPRLGRDFDELASELASFGREVRSERLRLLGQKASLELVINHLQDGVLLLNRDLEVLFANRSVELILGLPADQLFGQRLDDLVADDHPLLALAQEAAASPGGVTEVEIDLPGGERFHHSLGSAYPVHDPEAGGDRPAGVVVMIEDLATVEMLQSLVRYGARMAAMSRLTAAAVHEIKAPLHAMSLHRTLLEKRLGSPPDAVRESLAALGREIATLDRRVQDFLRATRPEEVRLERLDLAALLAEVAAGVEDQARSREVRLTVELPAEPQWIDGDAERLRQVFLNLIHNAFEAMHESGDLRLAVAASGPFVAVTVEDSGVGIAEADRERIFQLYFTTRPSGHGVGLFLVYRIVQHHGGMVDVESEPGRGTRMTVRLPVAGMLGGRDDADAAGGGVGAVAL